MTVVINRTADRYDAIANAILQHCKTIAPEECPEYETRFVEGEKFTPHWHGYHYRDAAGAGLWPDRWITVVSGNSGCSA